MSRLWDDTRRLLLPLLFPQEAACHLCERATEGEGHILCPACEAALRALGYSDLRVRLTERGARLELPESQIECAASQRAAILDILDGFGEVTLDLRGRKE